MNEALNVKNEGGIKEKADRKQVIIKYVSENGSIYKKGSKRIIRLGGFHNKTNFKVNVRRRTSDCGR